MGGDRANKLDLGTFIHEHRDVLGPMFARCRLGEQAEIVAALHDYTLDPNDSAARERWVRIVSTLGVG